MNHLFELLVTLFTGNLIMAGRHHFMVLYLCIGDVLA